MTTTEKLARDAEAIFDSRLREKLEASNLNSFVAIEPVSGDHFLGDTLSAAVGAARVAHPDRLIHVMRVGHRAAVHIGLLLQ